MEFTSPPLLFSADTVTAIIAAAQRKDRELRLSTDLGISEDMARFNPDHTTLQFNDGSQIKLSLMPKIKPRTVYFVNAEHELQSLHFFCDKTNYVYKLLCTQDLPSFSISSAPMHQITRSTPGQDTASKIKLLLPIATHFHCLDTCFGLGYSSGALAEHAHSVITYERDPNVLNLARCNPYSQSTLHSEKVNLVNDDICRAIMDHDRSEFDLILHDPPTPKISPLLYSGEFYSQLKRVLKKKGKLYHYCPRPNMQVRKRDFTAEVRRRLEENGFRVKKYCDRAQGLLAEAY